MTHLLPLMTLLACGGGDDAAPKGPTGPTPPPDAGEDEAAPDAAAPSGTPGLLGLRDGDADCAVVHWERPDAEPKTVGTFEGPCPETPTWVRHPDGGRVLVTWGDRALEVVDVDLEAGTADRAPSLPGATVAAFVAAPVPEAPPAEEGAPEEGTPEEGTAGTEEEAAAPAPPPPDLVVATQLLRTEQRSDAKGSYFEVDGTQLRFDRNAALLYDTTIVRVQALGPDGWERRDTVLWLREEGAPDREAFPEDLGARGLAHGPSEPQGAGGAEPTDDLKQVAEAVWRSRDADGRAWAHATDTRDERRARTPVAVRVDENWKLVEGLDADGPLVWQVDGSWLLAWDGAATHLVDLSTGEIAASVDGLLSTAP